MVILKKINHVERFSRDPVAFAVIFPCLGVPISLTIGLLATEASPGLTANSAKAQELLRGEFVSSFSSAAFFRSNDSVRGTRRTTGLEDCLGAATMQGMSVAFVALVALSVSFSAEAREGNPVIGRQTAHAADQPSFESLDGQNELAENLPDCRKVDVDVDEGYGVTGHVTRDECAPRQR
jgi:hypothetical protein